MSFFTATFSDVKVDRAQDLFQIMVGTSKTYLRIEDIRISQYGQFGGAAPEIIPLWVAKGFSFPGDEGYRVEPTSLGLTDRQSGAEIVRNNILCAHNGLSEHKILVSDSWNIGTPWSLSDALSNQEIWVGPGDILVLRMGDTSSELMMNATLVFEETGFYAGT